MSILFLLFDEVVCVTVSNSLSVWIFRLYLLLDDQSVVGMINDRAIAMLQSC